MTISPDGKPGCSPPSLLFSPAVQGGPSVPQKSNSCFYHHLAYTHGKSFFIFQLARVAPSLAPLTLIEMLIGMAITLVMMAAVVNLFASIGAGVRLRRSGMEMNSQLRTVRARLYKDLAGATCAARPKLPSDDHDDGYIEIIDGSWSDSNPSILMDGNDEGSIGDNDFRDRELDYKTSLVPSGGNPVLVVPPDSIRPPDPDDITNGGGLGDYDGILALTVRSNNEPFKGRRLALRTNGDRTNPNDWFVETIESNLAEIIWYVVENPVADRPGDISLGEPGMRTLYRRVLLIAPWVELPPLSIYGFGTTEENILAHYRFNDISSQVFFVNAAGNLVPRVLPETDIIVPNTLADLVKRENRFAHTLSSSTPLTFSWPYIMDQRVIRQLPYNADATFRAGMTSPLRPFGFPFEPEGAEPERAGDDVMLSNVLAWDLRVYDPGAPLIQSAGVVLEPSDRGWDPAPGNIVGFGAFVNLGWDPTSYPDWAQRYFPATDYGVDFPAPLFKEPHAPGWHPRDPFGIGYGYGGSWNGAVYDTWSYQYENDGINQDAAIDNGTGIDQGTNGFDDNVTGAGAINGIDDPLERETSPPYNVPLRGIQAKIRIYEPDSRQIRESTVTKNFVPN